MRHFWQQIPDRRRRHRRPEGKRHQEESLRVSFQALPCYELEHDPLDRMMILEEREVELDVFSHLEIDHGGPNGVANLLTCTFGISPNGFWAEAGANVKWFFEGH